MTPEDRTYLVALTNEHSIESLWDRHCRRMAGFGFDRLIYGFTRYKTPTSLGDPADFLLLTNHAPDYIDGFIHDGMYRHAPMVTWAIENEGCCSWSVASGLVRDGRLDAAALRVLDFNRKHGVTAGYSVSFKSVSSRSKGAIALTARKGLSQDDVDAIWRAHGEDIVLMNNVLHLKILTLPFTPPNQALTKRQREALEWVGDGKTMQDIAQIMGLTSATIEKHLRLAREALNVDTTAQAVAKAAFLNQMFVIDI